MTEKKAQKILRILIFVLLASLLILAFFTYNFYDTSVVKNKELNLQRQALTKELTVLKNNYKTLAEQNTSLKEELKNKEQQVKKIIDSLNGTKLNQKFFQQYQFKASLYLREKQKLALQVDSLLQENKSLKTEVQTVENTIQAKARIADSLRIVNKKLLQKINETPTLQLIGFEQKLLKAVSGDKTTLKARKVKQIELCFHVIRSPFYEAAQEKIYIQIINPSGNVIGEVGATKINNQVLRYSFRETITISKIDEQQCVALPIEGLTPGTYFVNIFSKNQLLKSTSFTLN